MNRTDDPALQPISIMRLPAESRTLPLSNGQSLPALAHSEASLIHRKPRSRRLRGTIRLYDV